MLSRYLSVKVEATKAGYEMAVDDQVSPEAETNKRLNICIKHPKRFETSTAATEVTVVRQTLELLGLTCGTWGK